MLRGAERGVTVEYAVSFEDTGYRSDDYICVHSVLCSCRVHDPALSWGWEETATFVAGSLCCAAKTQKRRYIRCNSQLNARGECLHLATIVGGENYQYLNNLCWSSDFLQLWCVAVTHLLGPWSGRIYHSLTVQRVWTWQLGTSKRIKWH